MVSNLLEHLIILSFQRALANVETPRISGRAVAPIPLSFRKSGSRETKKLFKHPVRAHLLEDWTTTDADPTTEAAAASRAQIHKLAWLYMHEIIKEDRGGMLALFRDMIPMVLVPLFQMSVMR
jgi:hypothetical protein